MVVQLFSVNIQKFRKEFQSDLRKIKGHVKRTVVVALEASWEAAMVHTPVYSGYTMMNWDFVYAQEPSDKRSFERKAWAKAGEYSAHLPPQKPNFESVPWNARAIIYNYTPYIQDVNAGVWDNLRSSTPGFLEFITFAGESAAARMAGKSK